MNPVLLTRDKKQEKSDFGYTLARVLSATGGILDPSDISALDLFVYRVSDMQQLYTVTLTPSDCFTPALNLTPNWNVDAVGYNFKHYLTADAVFTTTADSGGQTYLLEYRIITGASGRLWIRRFSTSASVVSGAGTGSGGGGGTGDFALTANPTSATIFVGGTSANITISVAAINGLQGSVTLVATPAIPGVTYLFDSPSVIVGGSTVLHISAIPPATQQATTVTVTGSLGTLSHSVPIALSVQNAGGGVAGFTSFATDPDTQVFYVSDSTGNDSAPGDGTIAHPWKTFAKGYAALRTGHPDWLLFKRGDTFTNQVAGGGNFQRSGRDSNVNGSGARTGMMRLGAYGPGGADDLTGARPIFNFDFTTSWFFAQGNGSHLAITDLEITCGNWYANSLGAAQPRGIYFNGGQTDVLVEGCWIHNMWEGITTFPGQGRLSSVILRRNVITECFNKNGNTSNGVHDGSHASTVQSQGAYMEGCDSALLEDNFFDNCGWIDGDETTRPSTFGPNEVPGNFFRRCLYVQNGDTGFVVRGNTMARTDGMQLRGGGVAQTNLLLRLAIALQHGSGNTPDLGGVSGTVKGNVVLYGGDLSLYQFDGRGWGIVVGNTASLDCGYNIIAQNTQASTTSPAAFRFNFDNGNGAGVGCLGVNYHHNVHWAWPGQGGNSFGSIGGYSNATVTNFICSDNKIQLNTDSNPSHYCVSLYEDFVGGGARVSDLTQWHSGRNLFFRSGADPAIFTDNASPPNWRRTPAQFFSEVAGLAGALHDTTSTVEASAHSFTDSTRTIETYMANIIGSATPTLVTYLNTARLNMKGAWDDRFTATTVCRYIQDGFDMPNPIP